MKTKNLWKSLGRGIVVSVLFSSCVTGFHKREIAGIFDTAPDGDSERVIVAEKIATQNPSDKILLIAIDQHDAFDPSFSVSVDASREFVSTATPTQDLTKVDPKFLLFLTADGVRGVYSFDVAKAHFKENSDKEQLPPNLVDVDKLITQSINRGRFKEMISLLSNIPEKFSKYGPLGAFFDFSPGERERNREAAYLLQILDGALFDNKYAALQKYFPNRVIDSEQTLPNAQLCDLASVLAIRYNGSNLPAVLFAKASYRIGLYCNSAKRLRDNSALTEQRFMKELEGKKIYVDRISKEFSVVSYDPLDFVPEKDWNPYALETESTAKMNATVQKWAGLSEDPTKTADDPLYQQMLQSRRVPYAILSDGTNDTYVTIAHFYEPNRQRRESLFRNLYTFIEDVKGAVTIADPILIPLDIADDAFKVHEVQWRQSTFLEDTSMQYGRLLAFLELSNGVDFNWEKTSDVAWVAMVNDKSQIQLTDDERKSYIAAIENHADNKKRNLAINEIVARELRVQGGTALAEDGGKNSPKVWAETRAEHWARFSRWINDPVNAGNLTSTFAKWQQIDAKVAAEQTVSIAKGEAKTDASQAKRDAVYAANRAVVAPIACFANGKITTNCPSGSTQLGRPVILFAVDGLGPAVLNYWADKKIDEKDPTTDATVAVDMIPNIKKYFLNRGAHFQGFTQHSVSVSSFSTILTGFEPDTHGVVVATSESRDPKMKPRDYLDYMADTHFLAFANNESMGLERIHKANLKWIGDYLDEAQQITVMAPVHAKKFVPYKETGTDFASQLPKLAFGAFDQSAGIDLGQADYIANQVRARPGLTHFIFSYFVGVDHVGHTLPNEVDRALHVVDQGIGKVMEAAENDPILKDAVIMLVSDHGLSGGREFADPLRTWLTKDDFQVQNSMFNVHSLMAGDLLEYPEYRFAVGTNFGCEARDAPTGFSYTSPFSLYNTIISLRPNMFDTCRSERVGDDDRNKGRPGYGRDRTMFLQSQGNGRLTGLILPPIKDMSVPAELRDPTHRASYYTMTHYSNEEMAASLTRATKHNGGKVPLTPSGRPWRAQVNMVTDLLKYKPSNFSTPAMKKDYDAITGGHAVQVFTMAIQGAKERIALEKLAGFADGDHANRDPVLVQGITLDEKTMLSALIFTKDGDAISDTRFRYVIVPGFDQKEDGSFVGQAITASSPQMTTQDPLGYRILGNVLQAGGPSIQFVGFDPQKWYTDRELISILMKNEIARSGRERYPTAIPSIVRIFTTNVHMATNAPDYYQEVRKLIPDFGVWAYEGYHFSPEPHVADHGGLRRSEVQTTYMITDTKSLSSEGDLNVQAFTRDIVPTIIDYLGVPNPNSLTEGQSLRPYLEGRVPASEE